MWRHGRDANAVEPVTVRVGVSDGVYAAVQDAPGLVEGDRLVIGLLRPGEARKPSVSLGGSKK